MGDRASISSNDEINPNRSFKSENLNQPPPDSPANAGRQATGWLTIPLIGNWQLVGYDFFYF